MIHRPSCACRFLLLVYSLSVCAWSQHIPGTELNDWPTVHGQGGFAPASEGRQLQRDASKVQILWETAHHTGGGNLASDELAQLEPSGFFGGCSSPVIGQGLVYISYFRGSQPARSAADSPARPATKNRRAAQLLAAKADDCLVAFDAETGSMRWQAVSEKTGLNHPLGEDGAFSSSPAYAGGMVYFIGSGGILHGLDAVTGKPVWTTPLPWMHALAKKILAWRSAGAKPKKKPAGEALLRTLCSSVVVADGVVVAPDLNGGLMGFHAATGALVWQLDEAVLGELATPCPWVKNGKTWLVCQREKGLHLIDPTNGVRQWTVPAGASLGNPVRRGDIVITTAPDVVQGPNGSVLHRLGCYLLEPTEAKLVWTLPEQAAYLLPATGVAAAHRRVAIGPLHAYVQQPGVALANLPEGSAARDVLPRILVVDLLSGGVVQEIPTIPNRFSLPTLVEDLIVSQHDMQTAGTGAGLSLYLLRATATRFRSETEWSFGSALHCLAGQAVPIEAPYFQGRLYLRTIKGLACLDLRQP